MSYINIDGVRLHYSKVNSNCSSSIFFIHGNSSSQASWRKQMEGEELSNFQLIAFDLPAHGLSDAASGQTNGYSLPGIGSLMASAIESLCGGKPFLLVGVSLGANIIAEMLLHSLRPAGIVLAGPCILGGDITAAKIMKPDTCVGLSFVDEISSEEMKDLLKLITNDTNEALLREISMDIRAVKDHFRSNLGKSLAAGLLNDEIAAIKDRQVPTLVIFGEADPAFYPDYLDHAGLPLWKDKVVKLPGAGHWVHLDEPEVFNRLVGAFAHDVLITRHS